MRQVAINEQVEATVTQMRIGSAFGDQPEQLADGNMIPNRCVFAGKLACKEACQFKLTTDETASGMCAEENMATVLNELEVSMENFVNVQCTGDNVTFGDMLSSENTTQDRVGFTTVPASNAFFFRPNLDKTPQGGDLTHAAMRMADCGDVIYTFADRNGNKVVGITHFSRPNMEPYKHELDGKKVSWAEYMLSGALDHYGADPATVKIKLVAAIEGKDFIHTFESEEKSRKLFAGWEQLGLIHNTVQEDGSVKCFIDYREMIEWQLLQSTQNERLRLSRDQVDISDVINTGDLALGHASHHAAEQYGVIENGRDWYIVGLKHE